MSPRLTSLLPLAAALAVAGLWSSVRCERRGAPPAELEDEAIPPPAVPLAVPPPPPAPEVHPGVKGRERVLTPGQRYRYTFDLDTRTAEEAEGVRRTFHAGWSGALDLTYLGIEGGQHLFSGQVVPTRVELEEGETPALSDEGRRSFQAMFERPLYVAQDARGRVLSVHFDARQDVTARRLVRSLLARTQFVAEEGPRWSTEETDPTGDFESEYRAGGSANTYVKTKRRYLRVVPARGAAGVRGPSSALPRTQGHLAFTLFEDGHVREVAGSDVVETGGQGTPHVREETRVALTSVSVDRQPLSLGAFHAARAALRAERLSALELDEAGRTYLDRQLVRGAKLEELMEVLAREPGPQARYGARSRLSALFRLEPAEAERAAAKVRRGTVSAALARQVLEALGSAGTAEAQRALVSVLEEPGVGWELRAHAVGMAGGVERPTAALAEALERQLEGEENSNVRNTAALAVGAAVRGLELLEPERSGRLMERLLARCQAGRVSPQVCLRALANAGSPLGLAYARAALSHRSSSVRGTATEALRAIPGAEPDVLLDKVMLGDPDARVRVLAVAAIAQRVAGPHLEAVAAALREEPSEGVRLEVVRLLSGWKTVDSTAAVLLRDAAENDDSEDVRRLATALLAE